MEMLEVNLYPSIHKTLRHALNRFFSHATETDWLDSTSIASLHAEWNSLKDLLHSHHQDEEQFVHPLLSRAVPRSEQAYEAEHQVLASHLEDLETYFHRLESSEIEPEKAVELGLGFSRNLLRFLTDYFAHIHKEDTEAELILELMLDHKEFIQTLERLTFHLTPEEYITLCGGKLFEPAIAQDAPMNH